MHIRKFEFTQEDTSAHMSRLVFRELYSNAD